MSTSPREASVPLTRWQYFTKTLYQNAAVAPEFTYNKVIYVKSDTLREIEGKTGRINAVLLLLLILMFLLTSRYQNIWIVVGYLGLVVAGQLVRMLLLPKDIMTHLTDTNRRER